MMALSPILSPVFTMLKCIPTQETLLKIKSWCLEFFFITFEIYGIIRVTPYISSEGLHFRLVEYYIEYYVNWISHTLL